MSEPGHFDQFIQEAHSGQSDRLAQSIDAAPHLSIIVAIAGEPTTAYAQLRLMAPLRRCGVEMIAVGLQRHPDAEALARRQATRLIRVPGPLARQFNVAAAFARGRILLLLAPGVILPNFVDQLIEQALDSGQHHWGWIDLRLSSGPLRRIRSLLMAWKAALASELSDAHPVFLTREVFVKIGGVPADAHHPQNALAHRLRQHGMDPVRLRPKALVRPESLVTPVAPAR